MTHGAGSAPSTWNGFLDSLEQSSRGLRAQALSLGVVHQDRVHTYNLGFAERTSALFSTIALTAALPGPHVVRTRLPQYFEDRDESRSRFPMTAAIDESHPYQAAACLPLVAEDRYPLGYLSLHYVDPRTFAAAERLRLTTTADGVARTLGQHVRTGSRGRPNADEELSADELRQELRGLREVMRSRARIEQAKGMLMERYAIDADLAWRVMQRWSSEHDTKIRDLAADIVAGHALGHPGP